jgi:hypothetical protein
VTKRERQWAHNWIPLTLRAALLKAHGNREEAERILAAARAGRRERRAARRGRRGDVVFSPPSPAHQAELARRRELRALSEDDIADRMGNASDAEVAELTRELDRRDHADRRRDAKDAARQAEAERLIAAGEDEETAYRRAYGVTDDAARRQEAVAMLRREGFRGRSFDSLARQAHAEEVERSYWSAEAATKGYLLSPAGNRAGIDPRSLFDGPAARANKYASEELRDYWREHGRLTVEDTKADLLAGRRRTVTAGDVA